MFALKQKHFMSKVKTFAIGFENASFDESPYAGAVARHFGIDRYSFLVTSKEAQEIIPLSPHMFDASFADSSQIRTHMVSKFAESQKSRLVKYLYKSMVYGFFC